MTTSTTGTSTGTTTGTTTGMGSGTTGGSSTDTSTTERAQQAASTAADESKHVAGVAASEAKGVAGEAVQHARGVVGDAVTQVRDQLDDQGRQQKDRLAGTLSTFGDDLGRMAESGSGMAADVAQEVAQRVQSFSRHIDGHEPAELLEDVRRFARQRPGTFLLGSLAAGVVVGRLLRGTKDAVEAAGAQGSPQRTPGAPNTTDVYASHGQPTQPTQPFSNVATPPSATGYSSPPIGGGLAGGTDAPGGFTA
jgi:hypothetical protein